MAKTYFLDQPADLRALQREYDELSERVVETAYRQAVNKSMKDATKRWTSFVAKKLGVPLKVVKKRVTFLKATRRFRSAVAYMKIRDIKLHELGKLVRSKRSGVRVGRRQFKDAFVVTSPKSGKEIAIRRKGKDKYPTEPVVVKIKEAAEVGRKKYTALAIKNFFPEFNKICQNKINQKFGR